MKNLLPVLLLLFCINAAAQTVTGFVIDKKTRKPIEYIIVSATATNTMTNEQGAFTLRISKVTDTLRIKPMGYKPYTKVISPWSGNLKLIELETASIRLNEVAIMAKRNFIRDSVNNRKQFAKEFAFKGPSFVEVMHPSAVNVPFAWATVDLLSLFKAVNKKHTTAYRLQQNMLRYEREDHTAQRFNKRLVARVTNLRGDTLNDFITMYRPSPAQIDVMTDYNMMLYIKDNLQRFKAKATSAKITKPNFKVDTTGLE
ncbi:carboxypeptidase-like regulatory domain-containing protein [Mucilaginibacter sp. RB4R14]|uniref:carboxypeptidase-like regulatory domain-containing protein n=1 Tax=Mucilaginibacter aurantiaciroseus TaxID=2949308 RepID=UPI002090BD22|nr:carboxypeptidase-like regulatory domain-containing protein [Mucilaginibacter aurantiaciroseus]MCO5934213.1 carboxypeptidase-like regulatory domain-containing protein [Mucilaginibacter aurantiaciroseus]